MSLVEHARNELKAAGLFDEDSDYGGALGNAVLELVEKFAEQGHSGMSAQLTLSVFDRVARFKTLTPITSNPLEWMEVSNYFNGKGVWQNRRNPAIFSNDGGKTWYDIDEKFKSKSYRFKSFFRNIGYTIQDFVTKPFRKKRENTLVAVAEIRTDTPETPTSGTDEIQPR